MKLFPSILVVTAAVLAAPRAADAAPPVEIAVRQLLVGFRGAEQSRQTRTEAEARELAQKARADLDGGKAFAEVSRAYGDGGAADRTGGFLGFVTADRCDPRAWAAIGTAKDGEVIGPMKLDAGFYVFQRVSNADAMATLAADRAVVRIALFGWKGAAQSRESRSKESALEDASSAITALAASPDFAKLPARIGAIPMLAPEWQPVTLRRGQIQPRLAAIEAAAFAMKEGTISTKPVETEFGWVVIGRGTYFRCYIAHLIVLHKDAPNGAGAGVQRTKAEAKIRCAEALAKLRADPSSWVKVVGEYSEEPQAAEREGMLPMPVEPGAQLVPEFIEAAGRMAPNSISDLVETAFGWHILRRLN